MPTFPTPRPIALTVEVVCGQAEIIATDRADTVVRIEPADLAEQTSIEFADDALIVKARKPRGLNYLIGRDDPINLTIEVPTGSSLDISSSRATVRTRGDLGEVTVQTALGPIELDHTGLLTADTATAPVTVAKVTGHAKVNGASGKIRIAEIEGSASISTANSAVWVGSVSSDVHISGAIGAITVERAGASVSAKNASGDIRIGRVRIGQTELATAHGEIEVGIAEGTAAWIDARSTRGSVHNSLPVRDDPDEFRDTVSVRARTRSGDIMIHRA